MFKKEIHEFLEANGAIYQENYTPDNYEIDEDDEDWYPLFDCAYIHKDNKFSIYYNKDKMVFADDKDGHPLKPIMKDKDVSNIQFKNVTLDIVKETLKNAGILPTWGQSMDALMSAVKVALKKQKTADQLKLGCNLNFIITDDFNFERNKTMKQEYQEITMINLSAVLELNGFIHDIDNSTRGYTFYKREDCIIKYSSSKWILDTTSLFCKGKIRNGNLQSFIQHVEVHCGTLKRLPKEPKFSGVQYLTENLPTCSIKVKSVELSIYLDNHTNTSKGALHLSVFEVETKELCDKIIEIVKKIWAL